METIRIVCIAAFLAAMPIAGATTAHWDEKPVMSPPTWAQKWAQWVLDPNTTEPDQLTLTPIQDPSRPDPECLNGTPCPRPRSEPKPGEIGDGIPQTPEAAVTGQAAVRGALTISTWTPERIPIPSFTFTAGDETGRPFVAVAFRSASPTETSCRKEKLDIKLRNNAMTPCRCPPGYYLAYSDDERIWHLKCRRSDAVFPVMVVPTPDPHVVLDFMDRPSCLGKSCPPIPMRLDGANLISGFAALPGAGRAVAVRSGLGP